MKVNYALILAAGFGTRMGELGNSLPKVLWPIMDKEILGLQIEQLKEMGIQNIYVNTHYLSELIHAFLKCHYPDVVILHEKELLGSGGAIHNLAEQSEISYQGNLLVINGDQFYMFEQEAFDELTKEGDFLVRLMAMDVDRNSNYNGLVVANGTLSQIRPKDFFKEDYVTFSGISYINLEKLNRIPGVSNYFESVASYKNDEIHVVYPKEQEYWDFGTKDLYVSNILKFRDFCSNATSSKFIDFCKNQHIKVNEELFNDDGTMNLRLNKTLREI